MKAIHAVPESITRDEYLTLVSAVGIDPAEVRLLEFRKDGIYAEVFARDPETGKKIFDDARDELVINRIWIPVKDKD